MVDVGAAPIDRYVVLEHLSEGGMGAIYVGKKLGAGGFEMEVVLKQLLPEFTQQEEFIDLFLREAKLSATLDHANIVHTIDLVTAGGEYFIVMEYLPGGDLRTLLKKAKRRGKRFSPAAAIHICREVLSALAYAHVKRDLEGTPLKLIHRDVSPSNILVSYDGEVKLTDFGIAKAATHNSLFYKVKGKIGYMSPEQARSESLDHRSDLYSLAVCMYEVLTGERLFVHAGLTTPAEEIYSQPVPQISRKVPGLTPDLDAIMSKALSISADTRFQTAGEFQEALTRCAHRNGLLISAPEFARQLVDLCGPHDQWRGDDDDDDLGYVRRAGTEVYDGGDEEEDDLRASSPSLPNLAPRPGVARLPGLPPAPGTRQPPAPGTRQPSPPAAPRARVPSAPTPGSSGPSSSARISSSRLGRARSDARLQGVVELTSIINMIDLEAQHREAMGEKPLVDHDLQPGLDSGPQPQMMENATTTPIPRPRPQYAIAYPPSPREPQPYTQHSHAPPPPIRPAPSMAPLPLPSPYETGSPYGQGAPGAPYGQDAPGASYGQSAPSSQYGQPMRGPFDAPMPSAPMPSMPPMPSAPMPSMPSVPLDPRDLLPTRPRAMPGAPNPMALGAYAQAQVPHFQAPARGGTQGRRRSFIRSWMVIVAILVAAAVAGVVVAMSGPDVPVQRGK
jgi:serine/threonine protein kinase